MTPKRSSTQKPICPQGKDQCIERKCDAWIPPCMWGDEENYCAARDSGDSTVPCPRGEICKGHCKLIEKQRRDNPALSA